jgi:putative ABC transport system permease protein
MEALSRSLRLSLRQIRRQPGFAAAVVLTLALAIGANTAIFSFVNALLIRPFPFRDSDQLVEIRSMRGGQPGRLSVREILDIQEQTTTLEAIAAHTNSAGGYNFSGEGRPEEWRTILTTGNLFDVLGAPLAVGGTWPQTLDRTRDARVVLTYGVWQRSFGGRRDIVGKVITLDHIGGYVIQGVTAPGFDFPRGIEIYRSIGGFANYERRDSRNVVAIARIRRPYSVARVQAELDAVSHRLSTQFPDTNAGLSFRATAFRDIYAGDARPYLVVLLGAVGFVLLIACSNVVNLLLSRALSREREVAVRIAIGAGRSAILGQLLTESVVLSLIAGGLGLTMAYWWMRLLRAIIGAELPGWMVIDIDGGVLAFTVAIAVIAGILSGLAPAFHVSRGSVAESLKEAARGSSAGRLSGRLRDWLIVAEVALAVVLLAGAGLMIRGFGRLQAQEKGFRTASIQTFRVALGRHYAGQDAKVQYYERAQRDLTAIPGVQNVAFIYNPPLARLDAVPPPVQIEGQSAADALRNPYVNLQMISDNYFELMKIPMKAGRSFTEFDRQGTEPVTIVSQRLARLLWPGQDPLGKRLMYNPAARMNVYHKVVGIAGNVQHRELGGEPSLEMYLSYRQRCDSNEYMLVKTTLPPREFERRAQQVMLSIDAEQSVFDFEPYEQRILDGIWQLRISRMLLTVFGLVALALAAIGIYGIMSYVVGQRTREMGIRLALGATPAEVRSLIVRRGAVLGATGAGAGLVAAAALGKVIEHNLRYVSGGDPLSFAVPLAVLLAVTIAASAAPAWRASRVDPAITLRQE